MTLITTVVSSEGSMSKTYEVTSQSQFATYEVAENQTTVNVVNNIKHNSSFGNLMVCDAKMLTEKRVRVIYTGGTIGMVLNANCVLTPLTSELAKRIRDYPNMHDKEFAQKRFGPNDDGPLVLPYVNGENSRVIYEIAQNGNLVDSSNMGMTDWADIAKSIQENYEHYDGFVILQGTDTLSYTASALSFMLENLGKTVVVTGSQIPIFETRTDGRDNFIAALIVAANYIIPEVCVLFGKKLMRGNRTVKMSSEALDAFDSPNIAPLATIGITVDINCKAIHRPKNVARFAVHLKLDEHVGLLRIFPSISKETICAFLSPPTKGVVLQTFGAGNIPHNRQDLLCALKCATSSGVIIVNCTQCPNGSVSDIYETGKVLTDIGVLPGYDMTPEAALTKLSYVLGKDEWSLEEKKKAMITNLRGELTSTTTSCKAEDPCNLIDAIAVVFEMTSIQEKNTLAKTIIPALVIQAIINNDGERLDVLYQQGADVMTANVDDRTPLHIAVAVSNIKMVKLLLEAGAPVHVKDRFSRSPLMEAILQDNYEMIQLLVQGGAHIMCPGRALGLELCTAAANGALKRLKSYEMACADLSQTDYSGRTALHEAAGHGHEEIVKYLLDYCITKKKPIKPKDMLGQTPLDYAHHANHCCITSLLLQYYTKC